MDIYRTVTRSIYSGGVDNEGNIGLQLEIDWDYITMGSLGITASIIIWVILLRVIKKLNKADIVSIYHKDNKQKVQWILIIILVFLLLSWRIIAGLFNLKIGNTYY